MRPRLGSLFVANSTIADNNADALSAAASSVDRRVRQGRGPPATYAARQLHDHRQRRRRGRRRHLHPGQRLRPALDDRLRQHVDAAGGDDLQGDAPRPISRTNELDGSYTAGYSLIGTRDGGDRRRLTGEPNLSAGPAARRPRRQRRPDLNRGCPRRPARRSTRVSATACERPARRDPHGRPPTRRTPRTARTSARSRSRPTRRSQARTRARA